MFQLAAKSTHCFSSNDSVKQSIVYSGCMTLG